MILFEDLQYTEVRETAGESATQGESDAWALRDVDHCRIGSAFHYRGEFRNCDRNGQWDARPLIPVPMYLL